ncbi:MAG: type II secretion system major pseudopilin GspG [Spirochaetota bacterium]|nr:type II secretion system major pseudopilin GspG [Spirochaetota bacterium]
MNKYYSRFKERIIFIIEEVKSEKGFTMIELMIVITIIGILSILVVPRFMDLPQKARVESTRQQISAFGMALDRYYLDNGIYPTSEQGLEALIATPTTEPIPINYNEGGYLKKNKIPEDPWGRSYKYTSPGEHGNDYEIVSYGADGRDGGEGYDADVRSWD